MHALSFTLVPRVQLRCACASNSESKQSHKKHKNPDKATTMRSRTDLVCLCNGCPVTFERILCSPPVRCEVVALISRSQTCFFLFFFPALKTSEDAFGIRACPGVAFVHTDQRDPRVPQTVEQLARATCCAKLFRSFQAFPPEKRGLFPTALQTRSQDCMKHMGGHLGEEVGGGRGLVGK